MKDTLETAIEIGFEFHRGQFRKGGVKPPYFVHPMAVLNKMLGWGITEIELLAAAPTHDVFEDADDKDAARDNVVARLPDATYYYVDEMTYIDGSKAKYIASFADPNAKSCGSLLLKIADRLCNVLDFYMDESTCNYAEKYLKKANPIMNALFDRKKRDPCHIWGSRMGKCV